MNSFQMFSSFDPPLLQGAFDSDLEIDVQVSYAWSSQDQGPLAQTQTLWCRIR